MGMIGLTNVTFPNAICYMLLKFQCDNHDIRY